MKVIKALLVWLISIPICAIAWVVSVFYFIFVIPYKEYCKVLYGVKKQKVIVKELTKDELLDILKNDISNEKKDNDKNIKDTKKMS